MPLQRCGKDGKGWQWGKHGKCYLGPDAKKKAIKQALAIEGPDKFKKEVGTLDSETLEAIAESKIFPSVPEVNQSTEAATDSLVAKLKRTVILSLHHNSLLDSNEPNWDSINLDKLPPIAFADKVDLKYPHHWIKNGLLSGDGYYLQGDLFLHRVGLREAWVLANKEKDIIAQAHLRKHFADIGSSYKEISYLADLTERQLNELDITFIQAKLLTKEDLDSSPIAKLSQHLL